MEENKKKNLMRQIIRFAFVGGSAFVIDYGVMIFLTELIFFEQSGILFIIYRIVRFHPHFPLRRVFSGNYGFLLLSEFKMLVMWIAVDIFRMFYMIAKIGATAIVMVYNFITRKLFLEK